MFLDTSAVLRALLEGDAALAAAMRDAPRLLASSLLEVELARVFLRPDAHAIDTRAARQAIAALLEPAELKPIDMHVLSRAKEQFPREPVRALDAIHLATALSFEAQIGDIAIASCDARLRENARMLGFSLVP